jgi:hypothetical protein
MIDLIHLSRKQTDKLDKLEAQIRERVIRDQIRADSCPYYLKCGPRLKGEKCYNPKNYRNRECYQITLVLTEGEEAIASIIGFPLEAAQHA